LNLLILKWQMRKIYRKSTRNMSLSSVACAD